MLTTRFHYLNLPAFQEFDYRGTRHADQGTAGTGTAQIDRAFKFAGVNQPDYVLGIDLEDSRQNMHGKAFTSRQVLRDVHHGLTI